MSSGGTGVNIPKAKSMPAAKVMKVARVDAPIVDAQVEMEDFDTEDDAPVFASGTGSLMCTRRRVDTCGGVMFAIVLYLFPA